MGLVDSEVAVRGEAVVMVRKERRGREGPYSPQTPFTCLMVLSFYIYWLLHSLLALGAVSPRNKDQDTCFKASDPCFHEKYVKNAHR